MGACTSKPKDLDHPQVHLPGEKPSDDLHEPLVTKADEASETTTAQENNNVNDGTSESQKVEKPLLLVDLSEPTTEPTTKTDGGVSDESRNPVADLVAVVDADDSNKSDDGAQLSHNNADDHQTTDTSDKKGNPIDNVVVVAASETKEEVDEKQDGKTKEAAVEKSESTKEEVDEKQDGKTKEAAVEKSESTGEEEKSST